MNYSKDGSKQLEFEPYLFTYLIIFIKLSMPWRCSATERKAALSFLHWAPTFFSCSVSQ